MIERFRPDLALWVGQQAFFKLTIALNPKIGLTIIVEQRGTKDRA